MSIIYRNWLAFAVETTICVPPANAAAWVADGFAIEHLSADVAGIKQNLIVDPTLEGRAFAAGTRKYIKGIRNVPLTVGVKLHGVGEVTADGDVVEDTYLAKLLRHCMGGTHLGTSRSITGGTATEPTVDDSTGIVPGSMVAFQDTTSPANSVAGKVHFRRVLEVDGETDTLTLSEALPFAPANGDVAHAAITAYLDENVLESAIVGPHTLTWLVKKDRSGTDYLWQVEGSVASMQVQGLSRGQLPSLQLAIQGANFRHGGGGADGLESPSFTTYHGHAQLSGGLDILCSIQDYGTTTVNSLDVNQVGFDPGFTRTGVETVTEKTHRFEGLADWSFTPGNTRFTVTLPSYASSWYAKLEIGQEFRINFYQPGDGSGAGKGFCIHVARAQLVETPSRAEVGPKQGVTLVFQAMEPDDCVGGSNEDLEKSRFLIALA